MKKAILILIFLLVPAFSFAQTHTSKPKKAKHKLSVKERLRLAQEAEEKDAQQSQQLVLPNPAENSKNTDPNVAPGQPMLTPDQIKAMLANNADFRAAMLGPAGTDNTQGPSERKTPQNPKQY